MSKSKTRKIDVNNNGKIVRGLALSSIKSSGMRNFFIVVTIILSVSLLMVMTLFYTGMNIEEKRMVEKMQHVIYYDLSETQLEQLAKDERTEYVLGMKEGKRVETDGKMIFPVAYDAEPLKAGDIQIETVTPIKGKVPEKLDEVMLSDVHCKSLGIEAEPGQTVEIPFLDGSSEQFTISGIFHVEGEPSMCSVIFSPEYAVAGTQLKDVSYEGIVRIHGAEKMYQDQFLERIREIAADYGIARKNVNENNYYLKTLPGGEMERQENMLVGGVGLGILFVSVLVIYSVFYLAVVGRIQQFGQLRTIGMTQRQIKKMVLMEGLILCSIGIPIGLVIGGAISYFLRPGGWSFQNAAVMAAGVTIADIITVLVSIQKPAKIAASISPVDATKFSGMEKEKTKKRNATHKTGKKVESKQLYRKISPTSLASMSRSRNKKKTTMTMISLGVGGVLFMLASVFMTSTNLEEYARQGDFQYGEFLIHFSYNISETSEHGQTDLQIDNPFNEELISQIEQIDGVEKVQAYQDVDAGWSAKDENGVESMSGFSRDDIKKMTDMVEEGKIDYESMIEKDQVLLQHNDTMKDVYGWNYRLGDEIKLSWFDGEKQNEKIVTVAGILDTNKYSKYSNSSAEFIFPEETLQGMMNGMNLNSKFVVKTDRNKEAQIEKELKQILDENQTLSMMTLKAQEEETESSFKILYSIMLGLSMFIVAFSILNMLNTLITNILTRKHEFAMFQSIGMTTKQLSQMIQTEGLILTAWNLVITLIFGCAAGIGLVELIGSLGVDYMHFTFPLWHFLAYAVFTAIVPIIVSTVLIRGFQKEALVERLR